MVGGLSFLLILFRIIDTPTFASSAASRPKARSKFGIFLALIAAAGMAYGGWRAMQEEGTSFGDAADRLSGGSGGGPERRARPGSTASAAPSTPAAASVTRRHHHRLHLRRHRLRRAPSS